MRHTKTAALATLVCGALALGVMPLGATTTGSVRTGDTSEFCEELTNTDFENYDPSAEDSDIKSAKAIAREYRRLAKAAPNKQLKKDLRVMAKWVVKAAKTSDADPENFLELLTTRNYTKVIGAFTRVSAFMLSDCLGDALGDLGNLGDELGNLNFDDLPNLDDLRNLGR